MAPIAKLKSVVRKSDVARVKGDEKPAFETNDSGTRYAWETGSVRDTQDNKPRYDLIPVMPLRRLAELYTRGAAKYGAHNWTQGQDLERYYASMFRHMQQWAEGLQDEDHLAAVIWNAMAIMWTEAEIEVGRLPKELDNMFIEETDEKSPVDHPASTSTGNV